MSVLSRQLLSSLLSCFYVPAEAGVEAIKEGGIVKIATNISEDADSSAELRANADTLLAALQ